MSEIGGIRKNNFSVHRKTKFIEHETAAIQFTECGRALNVQMSKLHFFIIINNLVNCCHPNGLAYSD